jgi:cell division initiation protein
MSRTWLFSYLNVFLVIFVEKKGFLKPILNIYLKYHKCRYILLKIHVFRRGITMSGEKRFRASVSGFNKSDVNNFIEKILKEFDNKLKEKDEEIAALKNQNRDVKAKYEDLARKADQINDDRAKIGDVLIKAQEKAEIMLEDARVNAMEEKKKLEQMIEVEREKLVDVKEELKKLRNDAIETLHKYEGQLGVIAEGEKTEN